MFEAFDVSAFHYLLKPIAEQKFMEVLGRAAGEVPCGKITDLGFRLLLLYEAVYLLPDDFFIIHHCYIQNSSPRILLCSAIYFIGRFLEQKFMEVLGRAEEEARKRKGQKERQIFIRAKNRGYTLKLNSILYIESRGKKGYTGHPSILQIPHIRLYKLIMLLPCQVNLLAAGKEDAVAVIPRYVRHVDQISPVATVKVSMIALVFYRVVGKITLFLIVTFMAVGEMSVFLAHIFFKMLSASYLAMCAIFTKYPLWQR